MSNYRLISLLPLLGKVSERIMYNKLYTFLTANNIIYPLQFGLQKDHTINHTLMGFTEMIRLALDNKRSGHGVLLISIKKLTQLIIIFYWQSLSIVG